MIPCGCYPCWCRREWPGTPACDEPCLRPHAKDSHVRIWKRGGFWTIEMFTGEELKGAYIGEPDAREAFERAATWLRHQELQVNLATNQETTS